jgi:hypothetical protein
MNINNSTAGLNSASRSSYFWAWFPLILTQGSIRTNLYWAAAGKLSTLTSITTQKENILLADAVAKMTDRLIYVINKQGDITISSLLTNHTENEQKKRNVHAELFMFNMSSK